MNGVLLPVIKVVLKGHNVYKMIFYNLNLLIYASIFNEIENISCNERTLKY